jgi:large subunit ribosomal protein L21
MYAIVATGGKQLKVSTGDVVAVEKLDAAVGESVKFDVIFFADGDTIVVDPAELVSATVTGEVVEQFKGEKAIIFKFKKRKGYKRLKGHRQNLTRVRITDVSRKAAPKKAATRKKTEKPVEVAAEAAEAGAQE